RSVEELRLQHDHLPGRAPEHSRGALRGCAHRRCIGWRTIPLRHASVACAHRPDGEHPHNCRILPALCRALRHDPGWTAPEHRERALSHVRARIQVLESRLRLRGCLPPVLADLEHHCARAAVFPTRASDMIPGLAGIVVNGVLLGTAAVSLFPLLWMLSVSVMSPGEASAYPPPLLPAHATLQNYRELFARADMRRYLVHSVLLTVAVTSVSLVMNVAAGYAFAKLTFAGRDRIFRLMLAALVIPSQVAMVPLFLLLKNLGLVNSYGGVIVPAMASIFGIFL